MAANRLPTAVSGAYAGKVGEPILLDASKSTDPDGNPVVRARWVITDAAGETVEDLTSYDDLTATFTPRRAGTYNAKLTVTDSRGGTSRGLTVAVTVAAEQDTDQPPPPPPVDCVLSPWSLQSAGPWGACQPNGTQARTETWARTVVTPPANGGAACGPLTETRIGTQSCVYVPPTPSTGSPLADGVWPRLMMTPTRYDASIATVADVKGKIAAGFSAEYQSWITSVVNPLLSVTLTGGENDHDERCYYGICLAFAYVSYNPSAFTYGSPQSAYGSKAREFLMGAALTSGGGVFSYAPSHHWALIIDWIKPLLSSTDLRDILAWWTARYQEEADSSTGPNGGAPFNSQVTVRRCCHYLMGLVMKGSGAGDALADAILAKWGEWFHGDTGFAAMESFISGNHGENGQGLQYGYGYTWHLWWFAEECRRTALGMTKAACYGADAVKGLRYTCFDMSNKVEPYAPVRSGFPGGRNWRWWRGWELGAMLGMQNSASYSTYPAWVKHAYADIDPDLAAHAQWFQQERMGVPPVSNMVHWPFAFILDRTDIAQRSPKDVGHPLSLLTDSGRVHIRSSWDTTASIVTMTFARWPGNGDADHAQFNGHYQCGRNGPQLQAQLGRILSGHAGSGGDGAIIANNYVLNAMAFVDRSVSDQFGGQDTCGTRRRVYPGGNVMPTRRSQLVAGSALYDFLGPKGRKSWLRSGQWDYVAAELTGTYDNPASAAADGTGNPARVTFYERRWMVQRPTDDTGPTVSVIYDRWTLADTRFSPTANWLIPDPGVACNGAAIAGPIRQGTTHGLTTYAGATEIVWRINQDGWSGSNVMNLWAPSSRTVIRVGGPSEDGTWRTNGDSGGKKSCEEMDFYGKRDNVETGLSHTDERRLYASVYRFEISPASVSRSDDMLTSFVHGDLGFAPPTREAIAGTADFIGVRIGTAIFIFGRGDDKSQGSFVIQSAGTYTVLIDELASVGSRRFAGGSNIGSIAVEASDASAKCARLRVVVGASGTGAANAITVS